MQPWVLLGVGWWEGGPGTHLALHEHGHVHEHVVQLPDAVLQLDDLTVACLNLTQGLLRDAGVHDDLGGASHGLGPGDPSKGEGWGPGQQEAKGRGRRDGQWPEQNVLEAGPAGGFVLSHSPPPTVRLPPLLLFSY